MVRRSRIRVPGAKLAEKVEQLLSDNSVRRVCLVDEERSLLEVPSYIGDPAAPAVALKAPVLAAIRAFGTLVNECTIEVEQAEPAERQTPG